MTPAPAQRLSALPSYVFAVIGDRIRAMEKAGVDVIRLDIGSPDLPPPASVIEALHQSACKADTHGYSGYRGTPRFRQSIANYYQRRFGVTVDPETEVLPLLGSKEGIVNLMMAYIDNGDGVLLPDVGYPSYAQGGKLAGGTLHWMPVRRESGYLPDFSDISPAAAKQSKIMWVNYPNNPTGATADVAFYQRAIEFCAEHNILLASDNPYCDVTFEGYIAPSALQAPNAKAHTVEFMSFSKTHNMAGWRIGAAIGNVDALKMLLKIKSNIDSGHFIAVYDAAVDALENTPQSWIDWRNAIYQARRDRILAALPEIGLAADKPLGSLYIWAKPHKLDGAAYVEEALEHAHVSLAPGGAYGPGGDAYVRISVGMSDDRIDEAIARMKKWYSEKHG